jgi:hypothetical protein
MIAICAQCKWHLHRADGHWCVTEFAKFSYVTGRIELYESRLIPCERKNPTGECKDWSSNVDPEVPIDSPNWIA